MTSDPLGRSQQDFIESRYRRAQQAAVRTDQRHGVSGQCQAQVAGVGRVQDPPALTLAGIDRQHGPVLAVDQHVIAFTSVLPIHDRVCGDCSVRGNTQVGDDEQLLRDRRGHGIRARADNEKARHAAEHLLGSQLMRMGVVPVGPGAADRQRELIGASRARSDRVHRVAILRGRHWQAVPVHGRLLRKLVLQADARLVAFENVNERSGHQRVVRPELG